ASALVTLPVPPVMPDILLLRASITACNPVAEPPPAEVQDTLETALFTADACDRTLTCWLMTLTAFATLSVRALSAALVTLKTLRACERALAAWALTADTSFEVTLPVPPAVAEIRLLRASMIDCRPRVLTLPAERAEIAERSTDTADQMEASFTDALFDTTLPILTAFAEALLLTTLSADV